MRAKRTWSALTWIALVGGFALGLLVRPFWPRPEPVRGPAEASGGGSVSELAAGAGLAERHCSSCHLTPDPTLLTKRQWVHQIMPQMAVWLGVEPVNYGTQKDGKMLERAGLFPDQPQLSEEEWFSIWRYYQERAPSEPLPASNPPTIAETTRQFAPRKLNFNAGAPMISLVQIETNRLYVGDGYANIFATLDAAGNVLDRVRVSSAPVGLTLAPEGAYVTLIGRLFPSDVPEGSVVLLRDGATGPEVVLDELRRPAHALMADLNGDGRKDWLVCAFGNRLGHFAWFEALGDTHFAERMLINAPGAVRAEVHDVDRDGRPDVVVQMAQAREGLYLLLNRGRGEFEPRVLIEKPPVFGYVYFQLVDFNRDGWVDILTVNGDNGDNPAPHKAYHGLRLYLNDGANRFEEAWFIPMEGAYKAIPADFDGDGDLDLAAIAFYPDWSNGGADSALYLENTGAGFAARRLPEATAGRWMTMDAGDLDGDGDLDLALGSYSRGPVTIPVPDEVERGWQQAGAAVLILVNVGAVN